MSTNDNVIDRTTECPGCGNTLWVRDSDLPAVSGTLVQVTPSDDCPHCGYDGGFQ